jgi:hypothetical protein
MQTNKEKKIMEPKNLVKIINVVGQNKEELVILLIKLYNGENITRVALTIELKLKNILYKRQLKMLEFQKKA